MAQPVAYVPVTSFLSYQGAQPWFPGQNIDIELQALKSTTDQIRTNLALIQRDDGTLANGSVGYNQLNAAMQLAFVTGVSSIATAPTTGTGNIVFSNAPTLTGMTLAPTALSSTKAIASTQSTPITGTIAGPFALNTFDITYSTRITGSGSDATGNNNVGAVGFRVNQTITTAGVAGTSAPIITGLFTATVSTTTAITDVTALAGTAYTNVAMAGGGYLEGLNGVAHVGPTGSATIACGLDVGAYIDTGGTAINRFGISVLSGGNVNGTTLDAAIVFNSNTTTKFNKIFAFSNFSSTAPVGASTDIFYADTAYSIANFANLGTMAVSGNIMLFQKFGLSGDGRMVLGGASNTLPTLPIVFKAGVTSGGSATISSSANTTVGLSGFDVINSTSALEAFLFANEPARTAVRQGQTSGGWAEIGSLGGNGLLFGTEDSTPLIVGTNNTNRMQITAGGQVNIGTYVAPATNAALTVNKNAAVLKNTTLFPLLHLGSTDSTQSVLVIDGFGGAGFQPFIVCRNAAGTGASPTAIQSGSQLGFFGMVGATGAGTYAAENGAAGGVFFGAVATENWSLTNQGANIKLYTTTNGTAAIVETLRLQAPAVTLNPGVAVAAGGTAGTGYLMSSTANFGVFYGSGAPSLSAAQGSVYLRTDGSSTSTRLYVNTNGSTTWTNVTTAA